MTTELDQAYRRLVAQFPDVPADAVASVLGDSFQLVVGQTSQPLVSKAEDLTRLRLEVRTRHPALSTPNGSVVDQKANAVDQE